MPSTKPHPLLKLMETMSFKALLFVQEKCDPCHRTITALNNAFEKSEFIEITDYKDGQGNKTRQAKQYQIEATPTLVLIRPSGLELSRIKGSRNMPAVFFSKLARYLNEANQKLSYYVEGV